MLQQSAALYVLSQSTVGRERLLEVTEIARNLVIFRVLKLVFSISHFFIDLYEVLMGSICV